ncbi:MAG: hypothetical protein Fur0032_14840 [Terrimicrobiaceae bacterium]
MNLNWVAMNKPHDRDGLEATGHSISEHEGIVGLTPRNHGEQIEIVFDPARLSEADIRKIASTHIQPGASFERRALRLDGQACEAAAAKLERRIEQVPGVRRATATYIGRVLCLTFDSSVASEQSVMEGIEKAGAKVEAITGERPGIREKLFKGELNEEISVAVGLICLIGAVVFDHMGSGSLVSWLYGGAYLFCGQNGVRSAIASLRERTLDVDVLMVLAAIGAALVGSPMEGALLLFLFSFSNVLQRLALERTQNAIGALLTLRPETATKKTPAGTESVRIEALNPGDIVIVRPGELLPVDGEVVEGNSHVDEASLTGESLPVPKGVGAAVFAGTLNQSGALEIAVTRKSEDSTLSKMVRLVAEAQAEKSTTQRFLEKAEQTYAAGVILFTILVFLVPWAIFHEDFVTAFYRAMTVMVVASPCALIISTPATVLSAIGGAARRGILIKGGSHLEKAARVNIVCFDKTGTLTVGKPSLTEIVSRDGTCRLPTEGILAAGSSEALSICAALESKSEHPLAAAIVRAAAGHGIPLAEASGFQSYAGKGAEATVHGSIYIVGSPRLMEELDASGRDLFLRKASQLEGEGKTCVWLAKREAGQCEVIAVFALADTLRPSAREAVERLHLLGVRRVVMLTGDREPVARRIAGEAGVDEFHAGLLPSDKVEAVRLLKKEGTVMMIGDGVNDAPALATAHLGTAMGAAGTDVAMETADVVLMGDRLENIPLLLGMARHAHRVLLQNLTFASVVIVTLVAAALGLSLPLPAGVIGHEGSTVLVCLNGLRLLAYKPSRAGGSVRPRKVT